MQFKRVPSNVAPNFMIPAKKELAARAPLMLEGKTPNVPGRHLDGFSGVFGKGQNTLPNVLALDNTIENKRLQKVHGEHADTLRESTKETMTDSIAGSERRDLRQPYMIVGSSLNERTQWTRVDPVDPFQAGSTELMANRAGGKEAGGPAQSSDTRLKDERPKHKPPLANTASSSKNAPRARVADKTPSREEAKTVPLQAWCNSERVCADAGSAIPNKNDDVAGLQARTGQISSVLAAQGDAQLRNDESYGMRTHAESKRRVHMSFMEYMVATKERAAAIAPANRADLAPAVCPAASVSRVSDMHTRHAFEGAIQRTGVSFSEYKSSRLAHQYDEPASNRSGVSAQVYSGQNTTTKIDNSSVLRISESERAAVSAATGESHFRADTSASIKAQAQGVVQVQACAASATFSGQTDLVTEPRTESTPSQHSAPAYGDTLLKADDHKQPLGHALEPAAHMPTTHGDVTHMGIEHESVMKQGARPVSMQALLGDTDVDTNRDMSSLR